jgi:hypothetical protein
MSQADQPQDDVREGEGSPHVADGAEFILKPIDDFDEEIRRTRASKELMAFLEERAKEPGAIPLEEVKRELGLE